jgi:chromosome segregation ATPase
MVRTAFAAVCGAVLLLVSGCATQDQLRETETRTAEQNRAVQSLRDDARQSEATSAELRREIAGLKDSVRALESGLAENGARTEAARTQADSAVSISRDFLNNLIEAREEQRRQLTENGAAFNDIGRRLGDISARLQAQQQRLEVNSAALAESTRRLAAVESGLSDAGKKSAVLETKAKGNQEIDESLTRQITTLRGQVEETRSVLNSKGLLDLMRQVENSRRDTAALRGTIEELQQAQSEAAVRTRNFYTDLDTRIQSLKRELAQQKGAQMNAPTADIPSQAPAEAAQPGERN